MTVFAVFRRLLRWVKTAAVGILKVHGSTSNRQGIIKKKSNGNIRLTAVEYDMLHNII